MTGTIAAKLNTPCRCTRLEVIFLIEDNFYCKLNFMVASGRNLRPSFLCIMLM